jgi:hypothetical protein
MTAFSSSGTDDLPLDVLWEDGERIFCRVWRVDGSGEPKELIAVRSAAEGPASATIAGLTHEYGLRTIVRAAGLETDSYLQRLARRSARKSLLFERVAVNVISVKFP